MCGIVGCLHPEGHNVPEILIERMTCALTHRGPDAQGYWANKNVGIGHTRLAIVDPTSRSAQPMSSPEGRYILTYSGEIYNYPELRKKLQGAGYEFHSSGDTEVVLNALIEWGEDAMPLLNGMFAFALWDSEKNSLLLARDRYGIKPLYFSLKNNIFVFGSEIKAILAHPEFGAELDLEGLLEYFTFQNFFSDRTLFKAIHTFPAGCFMRINPKSSLPRPIRYWDFHFTEPEDQAGQREYEEELGRLFRQAVMRQMMGDAEIGTYLSSGMDSGAITAVAASRSQRLKTFTCGFDLGSAKGAELGFDERAQARTLSARYGTDHHEIVLMAGDMERCLPDVVYALDEPRVGQSYPNYYASKLAANFVKVVLAGTGGDELFAGYPWRYYRTVHSTSFKQYVDNYYLFWQRLIPNRTIKKVFAPVWSQVKHVWTRDIFFNVFSNYPTEIERPEDYINLSLYFEAKTFLHGLLLVEDKLSMAHGLETRVPFLDNDLVDFAMHIPIRCKLGNLGKVIALNENEPGPKVKRYFQKTRDGKLILRKVMKKYVGQETASAIKQGFSAPDASWFRIDANGMVRDRLLSGTSPIFEVLDRPTVQGLVREHLAGKVNRRLLIWSLLSFDQWCRTFLDMGNESRCFKV